MSRYSFVALVASVLLSTAALADHAGSHHWGRTANPFTLKVHDNVTAAWEPYLAQSQTDWSASAVLDLNVLWGQPASSARNCTSASGRIEVCNAKYGTTGWLSITSMSVSGDHITKVSTKLNDTYFNAAPYNAPAWRQYIVCRELGRSLGLGYQDTTANNANLGSCMDTTDDPDGGAGGGSPADPSNEHPNAHDYEELALIYAHLDAADTYSLLFDGTADALRRPSTAEEILAGADQWGVPIAFDAEGRPTLFLLTLGHDRRLTHVQWAPVDPFEDRGRRNMHGL
jgi:hypothetical protein